MKMFLLVILLTSGCATTRVSEYGLGCREGLNDLKNPPVSDISSYCDMLEAEHIRRNEPLSGRR